MLVAQLMNKNDIVKGADHCSPEQVILDQADVIAPADEIAIERFGEIVME